MQTADLHLDIFYTLLLSNQKRKNKRETQTKFSDTHLLLAMLLCERTYMLTNWSV